MPDEERVSLLNNGSAPRTEYGITTREVFKGVASRIMFSSFYTVFYFIMACLALLSVILSLTETCPSKFFFILEIIVNAAMVWEVALRMVAIGRRYWDSYWNIMDLSLVGLCVATLVVLFSDQCNPLDRGEELTDTILIVIRNVVQFARAGTVLRKNRRNLQKKPTRIDIESVGEDYDSEAGDAIDSGGFSDVEPPLSIRESEPVALSPKAVDDTHRGTEPERNRGRSETV